MNTKQIAAIARLTRNAELANTFSSGGSINGPIVWKLNKADGMISGSNSGTRDWFSSNILIIGFVGPKGGIKLYHVEGVSRALLK